jgi:hypothetical protein
VVITGRRSEPLDFGFMTLFDHGVRLGRIPGRFVHYGRKATTAAWAVFGAARRWFQTPNRIPAEEMASRIETMVNPVLFGASQ